MSTIAYPALYGVLTLAAVVLLFEATPFLYRFVTGKIPSGSPRTLKHLDTSTIEAQLRREPLAGFSWVCFTNDSEEEESFARELSHLLERSGWLVRECARGACGGGLGRLKDVLIYLPDGGSLGLRELHELLDRYGYKSAVHNGGGIGSACIQVGQATH